MVAPSERGSAMVVAIMTLLVVTMAVLLVAQFITDRINGLRIEERQVLTSAFADAAMAETLARLDQNRLFRGVEDRDLGNGSIGSTVSGMQPGFRMVAAHGRFNGWQTTITAEVDLRGGRPKVVTWAYRQAPQR